VLEEAGGGRGRERPRRLRFRGIELAPPWQDEESRLAGKAAVIALSAGYLASRPRPEDGEIAAMGLQQADSMPTESAGTL
jgi:hypothetical protein